MIPRPVLVCAALVLFATSPAYLHAAIIRVGPGADFQDIQPAIDAALDGDIILVEAGTYNTFHLSKGIAIRSAMPGLRFTVQVTPSTTYVLVDDIGASQKAAISGMTITPAFGPYGYDAMLWIQKARGQVVLDNIYILVDVADTFDVARNQRLLVEWSDNVAISDLVAITRSRSNIFGPELPTVELAASHVRISQSTIAGTVGFYEGPTGIKVTDSVLMLSTSYVAGGKGENCLISEHPGDGGDGIVAENSTVLIEGESSDRITGGKGGSGLDCNVRGGAGGAGFRGNAATASLVLVTGGKGGAGYPPGSDGPDWDGLFTRNDIMPFLRLSTDVRPGATADLTIRAVEAGLALVIVGTESGFITNKGWVGPALSVLPWRAFFVVPIGEVSAGSTTLVTLGLPPDPLLVGALAHIQAAVLSLNGTYLTNAISRVIGDM